MSNQKLTQLPVLASLSASDLFYVVNNATSYKASTSILDARYLQSGNNLSDLTNAATARINLGLVAGGVGDIWVEKAGDTMTGALLMPGGDQATPAIAASGDTDSGLFFNVGTNVSLGFGGSGLDNTYIQLTDSAITMVRNHNASTSVLQASLRLQYRPTTPNVGTGGAFVFNSFDETLTGRDMGRVGAVWESLSGSASKAILVFTLRDTSTAGNDEVLRITPGRLFGINNSAPTVLLHGITASDAVTNAVVNAMILDHRFTGTGAVGAGTGILMRTRSSTTNASDLGRLTWEWSTATHASRKALGKLTAFDVATEREGLRWGVDGTNPTLGFLGATAIARPTTYTLASTATRTMPTPESAFTGQDNAQAGSVYAKSADLITLQTRLNNVEGVLRQVIIDLASTSGYGLLVAS